MRGSGGTDGGISKFFVGLSLIGTAIYLFLDSVRLTTSRGGWFSHRIAPYIGTGTTWVVFLPFLIGVVMLFYDANLRLGKWLLGGGVGLIAVEVVSQLHFFINIKTTHFLILLTLFAAGVALVLQSYKPNR